MGIPLLVAKVSLSFIASLCTPGHNTVAEAYRQLAKEGWLELKRHHGAIVRDRDRPQAGPDTLERFTRPLLELVAKGLAEWLSSSLLAHELIEAARILEG